MKVALITVIEADKTNIDSSHTSVVRFFEKEAIRCFTHWREHGGSLANIDIYAVCITKNTVSASTKAKFVELGVHYVEAYHPETATFVCGFYNKPLGCMYLEQELDYDFFIHVDLDMYLMSEPHFTWASSCMVYDKKQVLSERVHKDKTVIDTYNTCLMVTKRVDRIFTKWWDKLKVVDNLYLINPEYFTLHFENLEYRKLEELSFDLLSKEVQIHTIPNSIFGETYTPLADMTPEEVDRICFHHYHIYERLEQYNWIEDIKEWKARLK